MGKHYVELAFGIEGLAARYQFVKNDTDRIEIGPRIQISHRLYLLRRHIVRRSNGDTDLGQARIGRAACQAEPA